MNFTISTRIFLSVLLLCFFFSENASAQKKQATGDPKAEQKAEPLTALSTMNTLKQIFPVGRIMVYIYHDSTEVLRTYSDSSTLAYTRDVVYYFQMKALKDPSDGILEVLVNIDSLTYRFRSGDKEIQYDNRSKMELQFPDLVAATVPVNREFTITFSPYWEVVSTQGEMLDWLRNYIEEYGEGHIDAMQKFIWFNGISTTALAHVVDIQKGALPNNRVHKDSTWRKPFFVKVDGIDCRDDSAYTRISGYGNNTYTIETTSKHLLAVPGQQRLYGIESMINILGGAGSGTHVMQLTRKGVVTEALTLFDTEIRAQIRNEIFSERVKSRYSWKLQGQLSY